MQPSTASAPAPPEPSGHERERPVILLADNRPTAFIDYALAREDVDVVLLRFDDRFTETTPHWPSWGRLPQWYLERTADMPSFTLHADRPLHQEAARYREWNSTLPAPPRYFCNPEEHLQEIAHRFAGLVGLPHLSEQQVRWVRNKADMKTRFRELGIACARFRRVLTAQEIGRFAAEHGWPVVLKPVDSFAAVDTYRIDGPPDLDALTPLPPGRDWMVEEFLTGKEYQLCALVTRGRVLDAYISWTPHAMLETVAGTMNADVTLGPGHGFPMDVRAVVQRLVDGMGIGHGYLHMEFFHSEDGAFHMSEVSVRLAGCGIPTNHGLAYGFDIFGATLDVYLDRVPALDYTRRRCVGDLLLPTRPGRVVHVTPLDRLLTLPGVLSGKLHVGVGDLLAPQRASNAQSGFLHVEGASVAEVERRMQTALACFELVTVADGQADARSAPKAA
ncbi:ATP-dependent carboxylate-amine ligase [Streptomyces sp. NPDC005728]|uniref:ATP-grasp domain-containing protein n=1 Tax=Streptomyces sp. NPDC005728 TaxID=3157054 RepID=UPI0033CA20E7